MHQEGWRNMKEILLVGCEGGLMVSSLVCIQSDQDLFGNDPGQLDGIVKTVKGVQDQVFDW